MGRDVARPIACLHAHPDEGKHADHDEANERYQRDRKIAGLVSMWIATLSHDDLLSLKPKPPCRAFRNDEANHETSGPCAQAIAALSGPPTVNADGEDRFATFLGVKLLRDVPFASSGCREREN
jgi:hypothetical protein